MSPSAPPTSVTGLRARLRHPGPLARNVSMALVIGLLVVLAVQTWGMARRPEGYDFSGYLAASRALLDGGNPYHAPSPFQYVYPLFFATALLPLALIPAPLADLIWLALGVGSLAWLTRALTSHDRAPDGAPTGARAWPIIAILALASADLLQHNLRNGQVNLLVIAVSAASWWAMTARKPVRSTVGLAVATAIKIMPGVLLLGAIRRRHGGIVLGSIALAAALCLAPLLVGRADAISLQLDWVEATVQPRITHELSSARGELWFTVSGALSRIFDSHLAAWPRLIGPLMVLAATGIADRPGRDERGLALYLAAVPLILPISEMHHFAFSLPGVLLASLAAVSPRPSRPVGAALLMWFLMHALGRFDPHGPWLFGAAIAGWAAAVALPARATTGGAT